ncbi:MAG: tRNA (cytidine(56)-2'-O)-methyltransferase [Candidatus Bathyarchaeia archaeon]
MSSRDAWRVFVFRLGHRVERDKRVTTHVFLVARAFGAHGAFYSGQKDEKVEESIRRVVKTWGGSFSIEYVENWVEKVKGWRKNGGEIIHLTMYGLPLDEVISKIRGSGKDKLVIVGGEKVPRLVYEVADWNVSITSQPHSEVGALSVFLHELYMGGELRREFENAKIKIIPQAKGKKIIRLA